MSIQHEDLHKILEDLPVMICCFDAGYRITYINNAYCKYFGKSKEQLIGSSFLNHVPKSDHANVKKNISELTKSNPEITYEHQVIAHDKSIRWQRWTNRAIFNKNGKVKMYQCVGEDITERRIYSEKLKHSSLHDKLTNLYNRAYFDDQIEILALEMKRDPSQRTFAIFILDIDKLKLVNDTFGHEAGDKLIIKATNILRDSVRKVDILARIGGDEFAIIAKNCIKETAERIYKRIQRNISLYNKSRETKDPYVSISIGFALSEKTATPHKLIKKADNLMYCMKHKTSKNV